MIKSISPSFSLAMNSSPFVIPSSHSVQWESSKDFDTLQVLSWQGGNRMDAIRFDVKFWPAGTGSAVWDNPHAEQLVQRFMPPDRKHGPMIGILHLGALRPTPSVLRDVVVAIG